MSVLSSKTITIGITGGIAGYKVLDLLKKLPPRTKINLILTENAEKLFGKDFFVKQITSDNISIYSSLFNKDLNFSDYLQNHHPINHIQLADNSDIILICPATANILGKLAHGIYDDLLTTTVSATQKPVVLCPAMNVKMWQNPIVQENLQKLRKHGFFIIEPENGSLACGYKGPGRLANSDTIFQIIQDILSERNQLSGKKILVTGGGSSEFIDEIRVISNLSSGKMAANLADRAFLKGAEVLYLKSQNAVLTQFNIRQKQFTTSADLEKLIKQHIQNFDLIIHCAAVGDFLPEIERTSSTNNISCFPSDSAEDFLNEPLKKSMNFNATKFDSNKARSDVSKLKIGKLSSSSEISIRLKPQTKILSKFKIWNPHVKVISFKAETIQNKNELTEKASISIQKGYSDLVVANIISVENPVFGSEENEVFVIDRQKNTIKLPKAQKSRIAEQILDIAISKNLI